MKKLQSMAVLILLLAVTGCGGGAIAPPQATDSAASAVTAPPSDAGSAPEASAAPASPSPQASAVPASPSPEPSPSPSASAKPQTQPSAKPSGMSSQDNKQLWAKIDKALQDEDYETIAALVKAVPNPDKELTAMYLFAQYNIYGQDGDDAKSVQALYQIPDDYQGRHADLIAYWKYVHKSFEAGKTDNITFDEFKEKYYKSGKSAE